MPRRSSTPSVTLFPFLAVLVCAMGALILLLLVTTRRIRAQAAAAQTAAVEQLAQTQADANQQQATSAAVSAEALERRKKEIAARIAAHQRALKEHEEEAKSKQKEWQVLLTAMEKKNQELLQHATLMKQQLDAASLEAQKAEQERQKLARIAAEAANRVSAILENEAQLQNKALALLTERQTLEKELEAQRIQQALQKPVFEIVAHDGNSGTMRRPILIECRADSLVFASEQIELSATTLNQFSPDRNPLLAGAEALLTYWTIADGKRGDDPQGKPYILLIVRPRGTVGFYVARRFLEKLGQPFGYELIPEDAEIQWPEADPQAVEVCRRAVDRALQENQSRNLQGLTGIRGNGRTGGGTAVLPRNGKGELIVGEGGEFALPEVEQLRNSTPTDSIDMLGPEWSPQRQSLSSRRPGTAGESMGEPSSTEIEGEQSQYHQRGVAGPGLSRQRGSRDTAPGHSMQRTGTGSGSTRSGSLDSLPGSTAGNSRAQGATSSGLNAQQSQHPLQPHGIPQANATSTQGAPGGFPGSKGQSGSSPQIPPNPLNLQPADPTKDGGPERKWGHTSASGAIGIEREVIMHVWTDRIAVEDGPSSVIPAGISQPQFHQLVASLIQTQALSWGEPPSKFIWRPRLKVMIHPGGQQHYNRIKDLARHWGLSSDLEHVPE